MFIQVNSNTFKVIHHIKDLCRICRGVMPESGITPRYIRQVVSLNNRNNYPHDTVNDLSP